MQSSSIDNSIDSPMRDVESMTLPGWFIYLFIDQKLFSLHEIK